MAEEQENMLAPQEPLTTPASTAITVTKAGNPSIEMRPIPEGQQRLGEPADQTLRRINQQNNVMGNTGADQQYRDDLSSPPLRPEMPANMLAPQDPAVYGQPSPSGQIMDENAIRDRRVKTDKRGRPSPNITMQGDEQTLDYQNRLATMQPDKEGGGWWPAIRAAIGGFAAGGPAGAAAAFGTRKLREHFDPTLGSREYRAQEMGRNAPAVETIRQNRKDALDTEAKAASTGLAKARTDALKNPKAANIRLVSRKDGVYAVDPATMKAKRVDEIPAEPGSPASARFFSTDYGVYKIDEQHPNGVLVPGIPGKKGKDVEDVTFGNQQINQAISDAQSEQKTIDEGLVGIPRTIEGTDPLTGVKKMVANPDYTYNMTRRRQLDDDIRNWRIKLKSAKRPAASDDDDPLGIMGDDDE